MSGNVEAGKKLMIQYGLELLKMGYIVYVPYWTFDFNYMKTGGGEEGYNFWVKWFDFYWLKKCDAIFRLPNWKESNKSIFYSIKNIPKRRKK